MPTISTLVWVNKSPHSTSLSNCRNEKDTSRQIRSHAVTAGHISSRVKRPIKRLPRNLEWVQKKELTVPAGDLSIQGPGPKRETNNLVPRAKTPNSRSHNTPSISQTSSDVALHTNSTSTVRSQNILTLHPLTTHLTTSSHPIPLTPQIRSILHYFTQTWVNTSFKLPGCIGYSQPSIPQSTITSLLQHTLQDATSAYSLLAASSARRAYLTPSSISQPHSSRYQEASGYATHALHGLTRRMKKDKQWEEDDATGFIFLAAYEIFSEDECTAERHLRAIRSFYRGTIRNKWVERLRGNLEVLVVKSLG